MKATGSKYQKQHSSIPGSISIPLSPGTLLIGGVNMTPNTKACCQEQVNRFFGSISFFLSPRALLT